MKKRSAFQNALDGFTQGIIRIKFLQTKDSGLKIYDKIRLLFRYSERFGYLFDKDRM